MFFVASKVIFYWIQPSSLTFLALLAGALLMRKSPAWGRRLLFTGFAIIGFFGVLTGGNLLILPLEDRFAMRVPGVPQEKFAGIILLGGFEDGGITNERGGLALNDAAERLTETLRLARALPETKVIFTGGNGSLFGGEGIGASVRQFLIDAGVAQDRITVESKSRTTYENATLTKALIKPMQNDRWLLVTSAYHMPRSVGVFRTAGFDVVPYPVDFRTTGWNNLIGTSESIATGLQRTDLAAKEWIGLIAYWISGRSSAIFPGP